MFIRRGGDATRSVGSPWRYLDHANAYRSVGARFYASPVTLAIDRGVPVSEDEPEVAVIDTNVLLDDACELLAAGTFVGSPLLRAADHELAVLLMSEQAYLETGYMYAVVARRKNLDPDQLQQLIEGKYLPRIRVVTLPSTGDSAWVPDVADIVDLDDVPHAQLARLVAPSLVYSHDKHLRLPGYAPCDRAAYDERISYLVVRGRFRETQTEVAVAMNATGIMVSAAVRGGARRVGVSTTWAGLAAAAIAVAITVGLLRQPARRRAAGAVFDRLTTAMATAVLRDRTAAAALAASVLIPADTTPRLEQRVARLLTFNPGSTITELRELLGADAAEHQVVKALLEAHPAFTRTGPYRWALGAIRPALQLPR